jgi:hypothetical protein
VVGKQETQCYVRDGQSIIGSGFKPNFFEPKKKENVRRWKRYQNTGEDRDLGH